MFIEQESPRLFGRELGYYSAFDFKPADIRRLMQFQGSFAQEVASDVRRQFCTMKESWRLYKLDEEILLSDADIAYCCAELSGVTVSDPEKDVFGDALEIFRGQWAKRASGQFFTDSRVTALGMKLIHFDPRKGDDLLISARGQRGFCSRA